MHRIPGTRCRIDIGRSRGIGWRTWLVEDQRFMNDRPDVLDMQTAPLDADVALAGSITAHLFAATTGSNAIGW